MPLPKAVTAVSELNTFTGLDVQEGVLARSPNSFRRLENFDLQVTGSIRKVRGLSVFGGLSLGTALLTMRDYQRRANDEKIIVGYGVDGKLYGLRGNGTSQLLATFADLTRPFLAVIAGTSGSEIISYLIVTQGNTSRPFKVEILDGLPLIAKVTALGVNNPVDEWTSNFEHSLMVAAPVTRAQPDSTTGIGLPGGRRYRWSWWNPATRRDSSLAPFDSENIQFNYRNLNTAVPASNQPNAGPLLSPAGVVRDTTNLIEEIPLKFDGPDFGRILEPLYGNGYTHVRFWATRDTGVDYFLVQRLYNSNGDMLSDEDGAVAIIDLPVMGRHYYGVPLPGVSDPPDNSFIFDGYSSAGSQDWIVDGGGQTGNILQVKGESSAEGTSYPVGPYTNLNGTGPFVNHADRFTIEGDTTVYQVVGVMSTSPPKWRIFPVLASSPGADKAITFRRIRPVLDGDLLLPATADRGSDPPPKASWGAVYRNRLWLVSAEDKTRLYFSEFADFESFPPENYIAFLSDDRDEITAVVSSRQIGLTTDNADQPLIVGKTRNVSQVVGASFEDFQKTTYQPNTGIVARRAAGYYNGHLFALTRQGLEVLDEQRPSFIGQKVKPITDGLRLDPVREQVFIALDTKRGILMLGYQDQTPLATDANKLLCVDTTSVQTVKAQYVGAENSPFSIIGNFRRYLDATRPLSFCCIHETYITSAVRLLLAGADGIIYELFDSASGSANGNDEPLYAVAEWNELPQEEKQYRKIFRRLLLFGNANIDENFLVSYSVDGGVTFSERKPLRRENLIGLVGKTIIPRIEHETIVAADELDPIISNIVLEYTVIGATR